MIGLVVGLLRKHWLKLIPVVMAIGLGICVRDTIAANARAEALTAAAKAASEYATYVEQERQMQKQQYEDSLTILRERLQVREKPRRESLEAAHAAEEKLRQTLNAQQKQTLDSMSSRYEQVIVSLSQDKADLAAQLRIREKELVDAEMSVRNLEAANAAIQRQIAAQPRRSSTAWKIATGVATAAAVVAVATR